MRLNHNGEPGRGIGSGSREIRNNQMTCKSHLFIACLILFGLLIEVGCSDMGSNPVATSTTPPPPQTGEVSFSRDIKPICERYGCLSCHGGSGGLFLGSVAQILQGGDHGPAVVPSNANASNIVKKLSPNPPFLDRMPQGGPYLPDSTIQIFRDWINQGAKDN